MNAQTWIKRLDLCPHPEGGYYRETYRADHTLPKNSLPKGFKGPRSVSTAIYFLLKRGQISRFHRIASDEIWHHYAGGSLIIHGLTPEGHHIRFKLGKHASLGEQPQVIIPAGTWFGAALAPRTIFALVGCTVAPGFDFTDFEMSKTASLLQKYPAHKAIIKQLCPT